MGVWTQEPQSLLPTAEPTEMDIVYFAGFYDGEGSAQGGKNGSCTVQIPQKDPEILYRGRSLWGGSMRQFQTRDIYIWVMSGDRARRFLIDIYPHLSTRRKGQIEAAGGLVLTGRKTLEVGGITPERRAARAAMTTEERHRETADRWDARNVDKKKAITKAWQMANRDRLNFLQRERRKRMKLMAAQNEILERNELVN